MIRAYFYEYLLQYVEALEKTIKIALKCLNSLKQEHLHYLPLHFSVFAWGEKFCIISKVLHTPIWLLGVFGSVKYESKIACVKFWKKLTPDPLQAGTLLGELVETFGWIWARHWPVVEKVVKIKNALWKKFIFQCCFAARKIHTTNLIFRFCSKLNLI